MRRDIGRGYHLLGAAVFSFLLSDVLSTVEFAYNWQDDIGLLVHAADVRLVRSSAVSPDRREAH